MPRRKGVLNEAETPITPDQQQRESFLREREQYASTLQRIIAQARARSVSCSPDQSTRSMAIAPDDSPFTTTSELMASNIVVDCSSPIASTFDVSGSQLSKRPTSSRGEGVAAKRVALGVLDLNAGQSPRGEKGKNSRYRRVDDAL